METTNMGSFWNTLASIRPSVWLGAGATILLGFMVGCLAFKTIPSSQLDTFKSAFSGVLLLWGIIVRDVFHAEVPK
jgi:hypothetical protein